MINFSVPSINESDIREVEKVLKSGWLTTGKKNQELVKNINKYIGSKYCVLMSSCTDAIHIALLSAGVSKGDEVITTPMTFVSTINSILYLGAIPVFVDIKENDFIIDEAKIESKITEKTKAILPVHYAGFSANLEILRKIANKYKLALIEDAAHSFGSKYKDEFIGQKSKFCCFSFYPTKNITTGEGGALVTNNESIFKRASSLALHGIDRDAWKRYSKTGTWVYDVKEIGYKYNMTDIEAALGISQLKRINQFKEYRDKLHKLYVSGLSKISEVEVLDGNAYSDPFKHLLVVKIKSKKISRDIFLEKMKKKNIICSVHFIPVYKFSIYKKMFNFKSSDYPQTEKAFEECVSLPFSSSMKMSEVKKVINSIKKIFNSKKNV